MTLVIENEAGRKYPKPAYIFKDFYPIDPPYCHGAIEVVDEKGKLSYILIEPSLTEDESELIGNIKEYIISTSEVSLKILNDPVLLKEFLLDKIRSFLRPYENITNNRNENGLRKRARETVNSISYNARELLNRNETIDPVVEDKLLYFLYRDFIGYGKLDGIMKDPFIEDISCNGYGSPIYIWHTLYESMPTLIQYASKDELSKAITRLVYMTGQQISISQPILEGTLPEGYRAHITLDEVSKKGDTFTIRKYKSNPFTVVDLIKRNTIDAKIGAYLWTLTEFKRSMMVCGAVASGKTALLNSIGMFVKPEMKVVTIEEVRELRLHENWIPLTTRPSFQPGVKEITLYDLLKSSLRQRPDYIVIGEVRGEETYTLFQSMAVGHGGICSIHADNLEAVLKRLRTKPMNIPEMMLPLMNTIILIRRVRMGENVERRVDEIAEIHPPKMEGELAKLTRRFKWESGNDSFEYIEPNKNEYHVMKQISEIFQVSQSQIYQEMEKKELLLNWMCKIDVDKHKQVSKIVRDYYLKPEEVLNLAKMEMKNGD